MVVSTLTPQQYMVVPVLHDEFHQVHQTGSRWLYIRVGPVSDCDTLKKSGVLVMFDSVTDLSVEVVSNNAQK